MAHAESGVEDPIFMDFPFSPSSKSNFGLLSSRGREESRHFAAAANAL